MRPNSVGNTYVVNTNLPHLVENTSRILVWNGLLFRSQAEVKIAQALESEGTLYFPNARGRLSRHGERVSYEPDFLVFNKMGHPGVGILEVDGPHHQWSTEEDHKRDRLFKAYGIRVVERFSSTECLQNSSTVVQQFLFLLETGYR